jgi:hypothetical protein
MKHNCSGDLRSFHELMVTGIAEAIACTAVLTTAFANAQAAELYHLKLDPRAVTSQSCSIVDSRIEPAAQLTIKVNGRISNKRAYSDVCVHSAQWYTDVFLDDRGVVIGLSIGQSGGIDGRVVISEVWRKK